MKKKTLIWQTGASVLVLTVLLVGKNINNNAFQTGYSFVMDQVMNSITLEEVKETTVDIVATFKESPAKLVSAVAKANSESIYAKPIDEKSDGNIKQVHSCAGGMITQVGNNKDLGLFIKIKHEKAISTYGHLCDINVVPKERVQRGEIIGAYDEGCGEEFYYLLKENL